MKKYICIILLVIAATGCKNTWDSENKNLFYQSCLEDASTWAGSPQNAKTYCDCMLEKIQERYPNVNNALDNIDSVINDPALQTCKQGIIRDTTKP